MMRAILILLCTAAVALAQKADIATADRFVLRPTGTNAISSGTTVISGSGGTVMAPNISASGTSTVGFSLLVGPGAVLTMPQFGGASIVGGGAGGQNCLMLRSGSNRDFSAVAFFDATEKIEHGAFGWGNSNSDGAISRYQDYWEGSDLNTSAGTPVNGMLIFQTSQKSGDAYSAPRLTIGADLGDITFASWTLPHSSSYQSRVVLSSSGISLNGDSGQAFNRTITPEPTGTNNNAIIFRENTLGPSWNRTAFYNYSDTTANNGGHLFYTGGVLSSQTKKLQIANDAVTVTNVPLVTGTTQTGVLQINGTNCVLKTLTISGTSYVVWAPAP